MLQVHNLSTPFFDSRPVDFIDDGVEIGARDSIKRAEFIQQRSRYLGIG